MPLTKGAHIGGLDSAEAMRMRCVCDEHTGCWHLRTARGRKLNPKARQIVWVHGVGTMTSLRAMWMFHTGTAPQSNKVVMRTCDSYDCINPKHLAVGTRQTAVKMAVKRGCMNPNRAANLANLRKGVEKRRTVTAELRQWLLESTQSGVDAAHGLGISQSRANTIRQEVRQSLPKVAASVFALGEAMNVSHMRRSA